MKGSISQAQKDYDSMPLRHYVSHDMMQPTARKLTKNRVATRDLTSREMSPRGGAWRSPRGLLNSAGSGQHVTVTSQQAPTWMGGGVTTNQQMRACGKRC